MEFTIKHLKEEIAQKNILLSLGQAKEYAAKLIGEKHSMKLSIDVLERASDPRKVTLNHVTH